MTKEQLKYLLDSGILQAAVDGKALQYRTHSDSSWFDVEGFPDFNATVGFRRGIAYATLYGRVRAGWSASEAIETPNGGKK